MVPRVELNHWMGLEAWKAYLSNRKYGKHFVHEKSALRWTGAGTCESLGFPWTFEFSRKSHAVSIAALLQKALYVSMIATEPSTTYHHVWTCWHQTVSILHSTFIFDQISLNRNFYEVDMEMPSSLAESATNDIPLEANPFKVLLHLAVSRYF